MTETKKDTTTTTPATYQIRRLERDTILSLYQTIAPLHFPKEELRSMENLNSLLDRDGYWGLGIYVAAPDATDVMDPAVASGASFEDASDPLSHLLGYALFVQVPGEHVALLDFYAMQIEQRDAGLGSIFLQQIRQFAATQGITRLYIETEDLAFATSTEEAQLRTRRNAFYERNHAISAGFGTTVFGVAFSIFYLQTVQIETDEQADRAILQQDVERIYRFMLPPALYETKVAFR